MQLTEFSTLSQRPRSHSSISTQHNSSQHCCCCRRRCHCHHHHHHHCYYYYCYCYYYNRFMALWILSGTMRLSRYQKGKIKINLDFLEQETLNCSGISWAICKFAPRPSQLTTPAPHHSVFTGQMPFLLPNQQHQSTEGISSQH